MDPKNACEAKHSKTQQNTAKHSDTQQNTAKHSETQQTTAKQSKTQRSTEERKDWGCLNCKRNSIDCAFIKTLYFSYNIIFSKVFLNDTCFSRYRSKVAIMPKSFMFFSFGNLSHAQKPLSTKSREKI